MTLRLSWPAGVDLPGLHLACAIDNVGAAWRAGDRRIALPGRTRRDLMRIAERIGAHDYSIAYTPTRVPVLDLP